MGSSEFEKATGAWMKDTGSSSTDRLALFFWNAALAAAEAKIQESDYGGSSQTYIYAWEKCKASALFVLASLKAGAQ
jgi:hypothetical protein